MEAIEIKMQMQFEAKMIARYRERIAQLRNGIGAHAASYELVQGGVHGDRVADAACNIVRLEAQMQRHICNISEHMALLDVPLQCDIIRLRYIEGLDWEAISTQLRYSKAHVYRPHRQAMIAIAAKLATSPKPLA